MHTQDNHRRARFFFRDSLGSFDAVEIRHPDVEHSDIRLERCRQRHRRPPVLSFSNDGKVRLLLDEEPQAAPNQCVIIGEQNSDFLHQCPGLFPVSGSSASIVEPVPGCDSTVILPPSRLTRSSIPRSPIPRVRLASKPFPSSATFTRIAPPSCVSATATFLAMAARCALFSS